MDGYSGRFSQVSVAASFYLVRSGDGATPVMPGARPTRAATRIAPPRESTPTLEHEWQLYPVVKPRRREKRHAAQLAISQQ